MASTTSAAPSLLSRLSPLPIDSRQPPPSDHPLLNNSPRERSNEAQLSSSVSSNHSHSLSKSQTSRSFSSPKKGKFGGPGSHLSSLPDEVLQRALPIPPSRSTNSSRWASSPPSRTHTVKKGFSPLLQATNPSSSPPPISSTSPSTSPALQQIETMLSQLRTVGSPSKTSVSSSPSNRNHLASTSPMKSPNKSFLSSSRSPARPDSFLSRSPSNGLTDGMKRPALGGKSRWARDSDEEPEPVELPKKESTNHTAVVEKGVKPGVVEERVEAPRVGVETEEKVVVPQDAAESTTVPSSPAFEPSHVAPFHIDWAEDEEDALPDLDDWGVTTESFIPPSQPETDVTIPEPPLSPTLSTTSTMSNRSKRNRRRNSANSSTHPPPPLPSDHPSSRFSQTRPPKPVTNRLFNSARAAALPPPPASPAPNSTAPPPHSAKQTPPHQKHRPSALDPALHKVHPSEAPDSNWRAKGPGPSPALFSKLSGMRPVNGAGGGGGGATPNGGKAPGEGGNSRRSRRGRSRTSSAAGTGSEKKTFPPSTTTTNTEKSKEGNAGEGWTKVGGGGTHSSRWA
ncbi:hypothetical protein JCM5350_001507 [Sporobolomyces pararoseus]